MKFMLDTLIIFAVTPVGFITIAALLITSEYILGTTILKDFDLTAIKTFTRRQLVSIIKAEKRITKPKHSSDKVLLHIIGGYK